MPDDDQRRGADRAAAERTAARRAGRAGSPLGDGPVHGAREEPRPARRVLCRRLRA